jgi:transcriptional regulator with XRE-family HTH domain
MWYNWGAMQMKRIGTDDLQELRMVFSHKLRERRLAKGLTQFELAIRSGVPDRYISRYELGRSLPKTDYLRKLAKALEVTTDYLLGLESDDDTR